jgi:RNA polymerase sigma factor (sigma-70 family)
MLPELGVLYREHAAAVWRYARSRLPTDADAEDVTSDVFARAMRSTHTFDPARGTPRAWLVGIARHAAADWWRHRKPEDPRATLPEVRWDDDPGSRVHRAEAIDHLRGLLGSLSDREREAIALRFGAELSSAAIGEVLDISPTAARMLVHRAVTKLRGVLADG